MHKFVQKLFKIGFGQIWFKRIPKNDCCSLSLSVQVIPQKSDQMGVVDLHIVLCSQTSDLHRLKGMKSLKLGKNTSKRYAPNRSGWSKRSFTKPCICKLWRRQTNSLNCCHGNRTVKFDVVHAIQSANAIYKVASKNSIFQQTKLSRKPACILEDKWHVHSSCHKTHLLVIVNEFHTELICLSSPKCKKLSARSVRLKLQLHHMVTSWMLCASNCTRISLPPNAEKVDVTTIGAHLYVYSPKQMQHTYGRWNVNPSEVVHNQCTVPHWGPGCLPRLFQLKCWKFICWRLETSCTRKSRNEEKSEYQIHQLHMHRQCRFPNPLTTVANLKSLNILTTSMTSRVQKSTYPMSELCKTIDTDSVWVKFEAMHSCSKALRTSRQGEITDPSIVAPCSLIQRATCALVQASVVCNV